MQLHDPPTISHGLEVLIAKAEVIEAPFYDCLLWTLCLERYNELRTVRHRGILRIIEAQGRPQDHPTLWYYSGLQKTDYMA